MPTLTELRERFAADRFATVAAGAEILAVDFAALNPESGPFWLRQGFRPLTTMWRRQ